MLISSIGEAYCFFQDPPFSLKMEMEDQINVAGFIDQLGEPYRLIKVSQNEVPNLGAVDLWSVGNRIKIVFDVPKAGKYKIGIRVRTSGSTGANGGSSPTAYWGDRVDNIFGYEMKLDGSLTTFQGDESNLINYPKENQDYGYYGDNNLHFGVMNAEFGNLSVGSHNLTIEAKLNWAVVDYVEIEEIKDSEFIIPEFTLERINGIPDYDQISDASWADYDNDGDFDVLILGEQDGNKITHLFNNDGKGNFLKQEITGLPNLLGKATWFDYNNDGLLDLFMSGKTDGNVYNKVINTIFRNGGNGNFFPHPTLNLPNLLGRKWENKREIYYSNFNSIDFDNDGDLDFFLNNILYENLNGVSFEKLLTIDYNNKKLNSNSVDSFQVVRDFNNDNLLDVFIGNGIYLNKGNENFVFNEEVDLTYLPILGDGSYTFPVFLVSTDYDNDGLQEVISSNYGDNGFLIPLNIPDSLRHNYGSFIHAVDLNNDGNVDFIRGWDRWPEIFRLNTITFSSKENISYKNKNIYTSIGEYSFANSETIDIEKDGDLDLIISTYSPQGNRDTLFVLKNEVKIKNNSPSPPTKLIATDTIYNNQIQLEWENGSDLETPTNGLSYNIYLKRDNETIFSSNSLENGRLKFKSIGNVNQNTKWIFKNLKSGMYVWSVQTIDHGLSSSSFAQPDTFFVINDGNTEFFQDGFINEQVYFFEDRNEFIIFATKENDIYAQVLNGDNGGFKTSLQLITSLTRKHKKSQYCEGLGSEMDVPLSEKFHVSYNKLKENYELFLIKDKQEVSITSIEFDEISKKQIIKDTKNILFESEFINEYFRCYDDIFDPSLSLPNNYFITDNIFSFFDKDNLPFIVWQSIKGDLILSKINETGSNDQLIAQFDLLSNYKVGYNKIDNQIYIVSSSAEDFNDPFFFYNGTLSFLTYDINTNQALDFRNIFGSEIEGYFKGIQYNYINGSYAMSFSYETDIIGTDGNPSGRLTYDFGIINNDLKNPKRLSLDFISKEFGYNFFANSVKPIFLNNRNEYLVFGEVGYKGNSFYGAQRISGKHNTLINQIPYDLDVTGPVKTATVNSVTGDVYITWEDSGFLRGKLFKIPKDPVPVISSLSKKEGDENDTIIVFGENFSSTSEINDVYFNGIKASVFDSSDSTKLKVTVPDGLTRDKIPISVTYDFQTGTSIDDLENQIFFEPILPHKINSTNILEGEVGDSVIISGEGFYSTPSDRERLKVFFGSIQVDSSEVLSLSNEEIILKIPEGSFRGNVPLIVKIQETDTLDLPFRIITAPIITNISVEEDSEEAISLKPIIIEGINFTDIHGDLEIWFDDLKLPLDHILFSSSSLIRVKVPIGISGQTLIKVKTDDRWAIAPEMINVRLGASLSIIVNATDTLVNISNGTNKAKLTAQVANSESVEYVRLYFRGLTQDLGSTQDTTLGLLPGSNIYNLELQESYFERDFQGLECYFESKDLSDSIFTTEKFFIYKVYGSEVNPINATIKNWSFGESKDNYNLITIPYELRNKDPLVVFDELVQSGSKEKWRLYHYFNDGSVRGYKERGEDNLWNSIEPGIGYALIVRFKEDLEKIRLEFSQTANVSRKYFAVDLYPGWNQIGNPFLTSLNWNEIITFNDIESNKFQVKRFENGNFIQATEIKPFEGFMVENKSNDLIKLKIPYNSENIGGGRYSATNNVLSNDLDAQNWQINFLLTTMKKDNSNSYIGMHKEALDGWDYFDQSNIPRFGNYLELGFPITNHIGSKNISGNILQNKESFIQDFVVETNLKGDKIVLNWDKISKTSEKEIYLIDLERNLPINMKEAEHYNFSTMNGLKRFKLIYGGSEFIATHLIPTEISVGEIFPNPFSDFFSIPLNLPANKKGYYIHLKIYNELGQELFQENSSLLPEGGYKQYKFKQTAQLKLSQFGSVLFLKISLTDNDTFENNNFNRKIFSVRN